jgi:tetratricopeptide (TPR) repeat protein
MEKLLILLKTANEEEQALYERLGENERATASKLDQWSAKDTLAHISSWKEYMVRNISATLRGENPEANADLGSINATIYKNNKNKSWDDIITILERVYRSSVECVKAIPHAKMIDSNTLPWQEGRPFWRIIAGNGYLHPVTHLAEYYFNRGDSNIAVKLHEQAADLTADLSNSPDWQGVVKYNLACCYALSGQHKKAINELGKSLELNSDLKEWSKEDPDLASIRSYGSYKSLYSS